MTITSANEVLVMPEHVSADAILLSMGGGLEISHDVWNSASCRFVDDLSARVVVMTERARAFLREFYQIADSKIDLIAHGIPDTPFVSSEPYKERFGVEGRRVALTFGLQDDPVGAVECMVGFVESVGRTYGVPIP